MCVFVASLVFQFTTLHFLFIRLYLAMNPQKLTDVCCVFVCAATRMWFIRHGIARDASLHVLKRRSGRIPKSLTNKFVKAYEAKNLPANVSSYRGAIWSRRYLLTLRFTSQTSRGLFIRVLNNVNASMGRDALKFLLEKNLNRPGPGRPRKVLDSEEAE